MPRCRTPILPSSPCLLFDDQQKQIGRIFPVQALSSSKKSSIRTSSGRVSPGKAMATLAESTQWSRNLFGAPVHYTVAAPGAAAAWSYNASSRPVSPLQREEWSPGRCCSGNVPSSWPLLNLQMLPVFPVWEIRRQTMPGPAVMPQSACRWNGLPSPRAVLFCSPGSLTTVSAATCWPMSALLHNGRFDGCQFFMARSHMAATAGYAWRAKPVSTCAPGCRLVAAGLNSVNRRFDLSRPALFFLSNDGCLFPNDRSFLSNDNFQRTSHEFGERDRTCRCFYFHFDFTGKASWTHRVGGNTTACAPTVAPATKAAPPRNPLCSKTGAVPVGVGVFPAWAKPAGHRSGSSRQGQKWKAWGRMWDFGGRSMHRYGKSSSAAILCTSWCSPAARPLAAAPSDQPYRPDPSRPVCRSRSGPLRAGTPSSHHDRGVGIPSVFGTDRSSGRSAWLAVIQRSKQVCVRGGRSSGCLPQSSAAVSLKPDTRLQ